MSLLRPVSSFQISISIFGWHEVITPSDLAIDYHLILAQLLHH